jgi:flagellar protein FliJ
MASPSALDTLIELATKETDDAAARLGRALRACEDAGQKLALLMQYRDDYAARCQAGLQAGLSISSYRNFQMFLEKLDDAIRGQRQAVQDAQQRANAQRAAWQQSERKRVSYDALAARAVKAQERWQAKRDQKQMDEHAARQAFYNR